MNTRGAPRALAGSVAGAVEGGVVEGGAKSGKARVWAGHRVDLDRVTAWLMVIAGAAGLLIAYALRRAQLLRRS